MALKPQISRPASTGLTRLRIGPNRVTADRNVMTQTSPYPDDVDTANTDNANVAMVDLILHATYQQAAAPTGVTVDAGAVVNWTISAACLDLLPGDLLSLLCGNTVNNAGGATVDALQATGLIPLNTIVVGTGPCALKLQLWNPTNASITTPAGYNPQFLLERFDNLNADPNPIP